MVPESAAAPGRGDGAGERYTLAYRVRSVTHTFTYIHLTQPVVMMHMTAAALLKHLNGSWKEITELWQLNDATSCGSINRKIQLLLRSLCRETDAIMTLTRLLRDKSSAQASRASDQRSAQEGASQRQVSVRASDGRHDVESHCSYSRGHRDFSMSWIATHLPPCASYSTADYQLTAT